MIWYARLLCHHPYAVLTSVVVVVATCLVLSLTARPLPSFADPSLGFVARGTTVSRRAVAWENLLEASRYRGVLSVNPSADPRVRPRPRPRQPQDDDKPPPVHKHNVCVEVTDNGTTVVPDCPEGNRGNSSQNASISDEVKETPLSALTIMVNKVDEGRGEYQLQDEWQDNHHTNHLHLGEDGFFCNPVVPEYGRVILKSTVPRETLLTLQHLKAICQLDDRMRALPEFHPICETWSPGRCCPSWSLPNYVALINNRTSCHNITQEDVVKVHRLLRRCSRHLDLQLEGGCQGPRKCNSVPKECLEHDAVYTILHYLIDAAFLNPEVPDPEHPEPFRLSEPHHKHQKQKLEERLSFTALFLPVARSSQALPFFEALEQLDLTLDNVTVAAVDLGLKYALFDKLLLANSYLLGVGGGVVLLLMWCYTGSLFI
ncbi:protein dispatched homolog 1-like, partial [Eriocheir sinensis]